jgi:hypothetical protein
MERGCTCGSAAPSCPGTPETPPLKLGLLNSAGLLTYWQDGILFRKSFDLHTGESYPDGNCNAETYSAGRFV